MTSCYCTINKNNNNNNELGIQLTKSELQYTHNKKIIWLEESYSLKMCI